MGKVKIVDSGIIYDNPLPQLKSRHAYFPRIQELPDKSIIAAYVMGEAFESVDQTTVTSRSFDMGKTWEYTGQIYDKSQNIIPISDSLKITHIGGDRLVAVGYGFIRKDPGLPVGNPETGGVLDNNVLFFKSKNLGKTWSGAQVIRTSFEEPVEASAPLTVLRDGTWVTPIVNFPNWEGTTEEGYHGRLLRSTNDGDTWEDNTITMEFPERTVTVYEQRLCQLQDSGTIVIIAWNEDVKEGRQLPNHYTLSYDNGFSFHKPASTGIMGQASFIMCIGGDRILALHSIRRNTDRPGIYGYIVNLSKANWDIEDETIIWEPTMPMSKSGRMAKIFSFLKFGQPSAIKLYDGSYMMTHWVIEDGQGKVLWTRFTIVNL